MLSIVDEFSPLTDVAVCRADMVPDARGYDAGHVEFAKYVSTAWDREILVQQHAGFIDTLHALGIRVHEIPSDATLPWQMYTRDVAFVVGPTMYFSRRRGLPDRDGEIDPTVSALQPSNLVELDAGPIEGGDVVVHDGGAIVGLGSRTAPEAAEQLGEQVDVETLALGPHVMHLDTRLTILTETLVLLHRASFGDRDLRRLERRFELIEVTDAECDALATNVLVVDPETVILDIRQERIADRLRRRGFRIVALDYSEPIAVSGSFRCATMPLRRQVFGGSGSGGPTA